MITEWTEQDDDEDEVPAPPAPNTTELYRNGNTVFWTDGNNVYYSDGGVMRRFYCGIKFWKPKEDGRPGRVNEVRHMKKTFDEYSQEWSELLRRYQTEPTKANEKALSDLEDAWERDYPSEYQQPDQGNGNER